MNSRERVIRAVEMNGPDRVPLVHCELPGAYVRYGAALEELYSRYPPDVISVGSATSGESGPRIGVPSRDTWGSLWVRYTDEHKGQGGTLPTGRLGVAQSFSAPGHGD